MQSDKTTLTLVENKLKSVLPIAFVLIFFNVSLYFQSDFQFLFFHSTEAYILPSFDMYVWIITSLMTAVLYASMLTFFLWKQKFSTISRKSFWDNDYCAFIYCEVLLRFGMVKTQYSSTSRTWNNSSDTDNCNMVHSCTLQQQENIPLMTGSNHKRRSTLLISWRPSEGVP